MLNTRISHLIILSVILILVAIPRFDRQDIFFIKNFTPAANHVADYTHYINLTRYISGEDSKAKLVVPFVYRPLGPYLASLLPLKASTALCLVNILFMLIGLIAIYYILVALEFSPNYCLLGGLMYAISFPVFYYGSIGLVDPVVTGLICLATLAMIKRRLVSCFIIIAISALAKETAVTMFAVLFMSFLTNKQLNLKTLSYLALLFATFVYLSWFARRLFPVDPYLTWPIDPKTILQNIINHLSYTKAWTSSLMTLGPQGIITLLALPILIKSKYRKQIPEFWSLLTGFAAGVAVFLYVTVTGMHSIARMLWPTYPFSIPLAMYAISIYFNRKQTVATNKPASIQA